MATQPKRWAVRDANTPTVYWILCGDEPKRQDDGDWPLTDFGCCIGILAFERVFPKRFHLKDGGGPVEIGFEHAV